MSNLGISDLQSELSKNQSIFRNILDNVPAAIAILDNDMKYIWASKRWYQDYMIESKSIIGKSHYDIFPTIPQRWKEIHKRSLNGEVLSMDEDSFTDDSGRIIWNSWRITPWYNLEGSIGGIIMHTEVITKRKEVELALQSKIDEMTALLKSTTDREIKMAELKEKIKSIENSGNKL